MTMTTAFLFRLVVAVYHASLTIRLPWSQCWYHATYLSQAFNCVALVVYEFGSSIMQDDEEDTKKTQLLWIAAAFSTVCSVGYWVTNCFWYRQAEITLRNIELHGINTVSMLMLVVGSADRDTWLSRGVDAMTVLFIAICAYRLVWSALYLWNVPSPYRDCGVDDAEWLNAVYLGLLADPLFIMLMHYFSGGDWVGWNHRIHNFLVYSTTILIAAIMWYPKGHKKQHVKHHVHLGKLWTLWLTLIAITGFLRPIKPSTFWGLDIQHQLWTKGAAATSATNVLYQEAFRQMNWNSLRFVYACFASAVCAGTAIYEWTRFGYMSHWLVPAAGHLVLMRSDLLLSSKLRHILHTVPYSTFAATFSAVAWISIPRGMQSDYWVQHHLGDFERRLLLLLVVTVPIVSVVLSMSNHRNVKAAVGIVAGVTAYQIFHDIIRAFGGHHLWILEEEHALIPFSATTTVLLHRVFAGCYLALYPLNRWVVARKASTMHRYVGLATSVVGVLTGLSGFLCGVFVARVPGTDTHCMFFRLAKDSASGSL